MISHPFLDGGSPPEPVPWTELPGLPLYARGKVRDIYDLGDRLLMIATDRLSAFDVIMRDPFPGKGVVLTALSAFWFDQTRDILPNHVIATDVPPLPPEAEAWRERLNGRSMVVRKAKRIDVECVVRGYLAGSGWAEYRRTGMCVGHALSPDLIESSRLADPIFTPTTKAEVGHDENMTIGQMADIVGTEMTRTLEEASLRLYAAGAAHCESRGIILADTKFEFGILDGRVIVIDELLTPDSSRFWPKVAYAPGGPQPSFDKQYVRDYLDSTGWNHEPPPPPLPSEIITRTTEKYREAYQRIARAAPRPPTWQARVHVVLKPGVNDPQGQAIQGGLRSLGYADVQQVRAGKYFEILVEAADSGTVERRVDEMCRQLLANPVVEDYRLVVEDSPIGDPAA
ncbi:MAG: phosphoribosylaminoimidazolesuccinocarboxamide synthase [Chloroflexi bacterium]|nr:phosphoribosylaminoimidazolesuccinocarboxamide synthase [Chloroflexota bacterium]